MAILTGLVFLSGANKRFQPLDKTENNISPTVFIFMLFALLSLVFIQFKDRFSIDRRAPFEIKEVPINTSRDTAGPQNNEPFAPAACDAHASARVTDRRMPPE